MSDRAFEAVLNIDDLRKLAKRRLPKIAFDFIEGGVDDEDGLARNEAMFRQHRLVPRYMTGNVKRDTSAEIFGRRFSIPYGISPTGAIGLFRPGGDLMMAEAAREANIPFVMSTHATASIEQLGKVAPDHGWYQMYTSPDRSISEDMIKRSADAGLGALVVTVDVPIQPNRERNKRNGYGRPMKLSLRTKLDALTKPGWLWRYMKEGNPRYSNWEKYAPAGAGADAVSTFSGRQTRMPISWADIERFRRLWPRAFIIKGIMHPADALRAADLGVDGLVVSNHGGRQLDRAASPLETLPALDAAVGDRMTLIYESGVRRGSDIVVALCLGAKFVFSGRPTLYGTAAAGKPGAAKALQIFTKELNMVMGQIGAASVADLGPHYLLDDVTSGRWRDRQPAVSLRSTAAKQA